MSIDLESLGYEAEPRDYSYAWRDAVLYALGVGAQPQTELDFLFEERGPRVLPTFAVVPTFTLFDELVDRIGCDRTGMVHESQRMRFRKPLAPSGTLRVTGRVAGLYDLKRMAMARLEVEARDEAEELVAEAEISLLLRHDGGFGGPRPPRSSRVAVPERSPDFELSQLVSPAQAALYRLSGDLNPLHLDPSFAAQVGFDRPILHGLCTFGYAGRAVLSELCDGEPGRLRALQGQFRNPVFPGDTLLIRGWEAEEGRVILNLTTAERPTEACLSSAVAEISR